MPLDGHLHLVNQGWRGKGNGLRDGAITRPLVIPQKKNLAGLGKDRDEAFPFWDHLFTAAAKSIQLKCPSDSDGESNTENSSCSQTSLRRTTTGILSNRRPVEGASATPDPLTPDPSKPRVNLLAAARRDAAKQSLYSRFFRGPVLGPCDQGHASISRDSIQIEDVIETSLIVGNMTTDSKVVIGVVKEGRASERKRDLERVGGEDLEQQMKKRKKKGRQEGPKADKSEGAKVTASHSLAEGPAKHIDSESDKRRKEKKKRRELKKKGELECPRK